MTHDAASIPEPAPPGDDVPESSDVPGAPAPNQLDADSLRGVVGGAFVPCQATTVAVVTQVYQQDLDSVESVINATVAPTLPSAGTGILGPAPSMSMGPLTYEPPT